VTRDAGSTPNGKRGLTTIAPSPARTICLST
jgi:hypothetical protein